MIGPNVDSKVIDHLMKFGNPDGPTNFASHEMNSLTDPKDIAGWSTIAVSPEGKPYSILRAIIRARSSSPAPLPFFIMDASADGGEEASIREAKLLKAIGRFVVTGGHGGAVLNTQSQSQMAGYLENICEGLLR